MPRACPAYPRLEHIIYNTEMDNCQHDYKSKF